MVKLKNDLDSSSGYCENCNLHNQLFDQATKKCINCSVPGTVSNIDYSGWTKTTYPVETCIPCDARANEYFVKEYYGCKTCEGTIELGDANKYTGTKEYVCTPCPEGKTLDLYNTNKCI